MRFLHHRWRRVLAAALLLLAGAPVPAKDTVTLCFERQQVLPWRTVEGRGLNFEMLKLVAARLDIVFAYQSMPWKRCLEQLKANQVGGAFAVSFNTSRMEVGGFPGGNPADASKRMHIDKYVLIRRKGATIDWDGKTLKNVDGAIGVQLGYSVSEFLRAMDVAVDEGSQRAGELAQKLLAGRLAAAAMGGSDAAVLMNGPLGAQLEVVPVPLIEKPYFLVLSHALVAGQPKLAERIWKGIEEVRNSAAYKKLQREAEGGHH